MKAGSGPFPLDKTNEQFALYPYAQASTTPAVNKGATCSNLNGATDISRPDVGVLKYFWEEGIKQHLGNSQDVDIKRIIFFFENGEKCVYPAETLEYHFDHYPYWGSGNFKNDVNSKFASENTNVVFERNVPDYMDEDPATAPHVNIYWTKVLS